MGSAANEGRSMDLISILSNVAVGGAILMAVIGIIKNKMPKN
jgi:hypothetical protein